MARVRPCVGRTLPVLRGIQSIWFLKTAVWWGVSVFPFRGRIEGQEIEITKFPCCSGETHRCPSLHVLRCLSSTTFGSFWLTSSFTGNPVGSNTRTSQPSRQRMRAASNATSREYERLRRLPYNTRTFSRWLVRLRFCDAMSSAVLSSSLLIQSSASWAGSWERRKGRYFWRIEGSSSVGGRARVRNCNEFCCEVVVVLNCVEVWIASPRRVDRCIVGSGYWE